MIFQSMLLIDKKLDNVVLSVKLSAFKVHPIITTEVIHKRKGYNIYFSRYLPNDM